MFNLSHFDLKIHSNGWHNNNWRPNRWGKISDGGRPKEEINPAPQAMIDKCAKEPEIFGGKYFYLVINNVLVYLFGVSCFTLTIFFYVLQKWKNHSLPYV